LILGQEILIMLRKNLLYMRKRVLKITMDRMSTEVKVSRDTIYRLENNVEVEDRVLYPNLKTLILLADYLKVKLEDLISKDLEMEELHRKAILHKLGDFREEYDFKDVNRE
jgi:DNA-binding XRE family transcriptional regulator